MESSPLEQPPRQSRIILLLIFSPLWLPLLTFALWALIGLLWVDRDMELRPGTCLFRVFMEEPLQSFPENLIPGEARYFRRFTDNGDHNIVTVRLLKWQPEYRDLCLKWLEEHGLSKADIFDNSFESLNLTTGEGYQGTWSVQKLENGAAEVRLTHYLPF